MLGRRRSTGESEALRGMKNEFMINWDGLWTIDKELVVVLAATNRPFDLDEAVIKRLPRRHAECLSCYPGYAILQYRVMPSFLLHCQIFWQVYGRVAQCCK